MSRNRLSNETSPYLLQHAENPVDWYPWGPEALARAQDENKPILLSIGYAACHWCHVMERECFENEALAAQMNESFVCIKVDREERPDLDDLYMSATIAISGSGGWPMTVFLTPEQTPFFAGTYFPPEDRDGRPGFGSLLQRIAELWQSDPDQLHRQAGELTDHIRAQSALEPPRSPDAAMIERAVLDLRRGYDERFGGFGSAPKFPPAQALQLLLRHHQRTGDETSLKMVTHTLDCMSRGGIYDQLRGGFARYSTDERWHAPHFEKMLYDNALLVRVYLEAFQVTGRREYERVVRQTLDFVIAEMQTESGGYCCSIDADSEGEEGKYYTFGAAELRAVLEAEELRAFCAYYDVKSAGNWEGSNILHVPEESGQVAKKLGLSEAELQPLLERARAKVLSLRQTRVAPLIDDKVLVSWNALMIGAMAEAHRVLGEQRYLESANRATELLRSQLVQADGKLLRTSRNGKAHLGGLLEDYAYLIDALIDLYEASAESRALCQARDLADVMLTTFGDERGSFFQTPHDHESLIVRTRDGNDGALPNANAVAVRALVRLADHFDEPQLAEHACAALRAYGRHIARSPRGFLTSLNTLDDMLRGSTQLVFVGPFEQTAELRAAAAQVYVPCRTICHAAGGPSEEAAAADDGVRPQTPPLAEGKSLVNGQAALYVCFDATCQAPVTDASAVKSALSEQLTRLDHERKNVLRGPRLAGRATPEHTAGYVSKHCETGANILPRTGLAVSRIGFGGYRVSAEFADHQQSITTALEHGCNLLDTAPSYGAGESELVIGDALGELCRVGQLDRREIVLCSKLGIIDHRMESHEQTGSRGPTDWEELELADGLSYSLDPRWLERQLRGSLERLNVESLDLCLLHSPEILTQRLPHRAALAQIGDALRWLETKVEEGLVGAYGVSSNSLTLGASAPGASPTERQLSFDELHELAEKHGAKGFSILELPLNPVELEAYHSGLIAAAKAREYAVLAHRPLNAVVDDELRRLADAPEDASAPDFEQSLAGLGALEQEFRQRLGAVLQAVPDAQIDSTSLLAWSERIGEREVSSRALWNEFERGVLSVELMRTLRALDAALAGQRLGDVWRGFRRRYVQQLELTVLAARQTASVASNRANRPLATALQALGPGDASLAQRVVFGLGCVSGVSSVLTGMRTPSYAMELCDTLSWPPQRDASELLRWKPR